MNAAELAVLWEPIAARCPELRAANYQPYGNDGGYWTGDIDCLSNDEAAALWRDAAVRLLVQRGYVGWMPEYMHDPKDGLHYTCDMADFEGCWPTLDHALAAAVKAVLDAAPPAQ